MDYKPNTWAFDHVHKRTERFAAYCTTRQCGKTWTAAMEIDLGMTEVRPDGTPPSVGVLASNHEKARLSVDRWVGACQAAFGPDYVKANKNEHRAWIPSSGAELRWITSEDIKSAVGFTFTRLIVDEAQDVPDGVWERVRPTLNRYQAPVRAFGTPDINPEQSWFKSMWLRGQDGDDPNYYSYTLSCYNNPWITEEEIADAKKTLPDRTFRMLYLGQWVDAEGGVFQGIADAILGNTPVYNPERRYVMGIDLAIHDDFTVVFVGEESTRRAIHMERWHHTDPITTYDRITDIWERYGRPRVVCDASGMGESMYYELKERMSNVRGIKITPANKMTMVGRLAGDIEHRRIMFPDWKPLVDELKNYLFSQTPSGRLTASAAAGYHDDAVMALVMLNEGMRRRAGGEDYYYAGGAVGGSDLHGMLRRRAQNWERMTTRA